MRKGVTPVIATVLLLGISVGASLTAWTYLNNARDQAQDSYEEKIRQEELVERTSIDIENIYKSSNDWSFIRIRNTGSRDIRINNTEPPEERYWSMYINGKPVGNTEGTGWKYTANERGEIPPQDVITLNSTRKFPSVGTYEYRITARYEAEDTHLCRSSEGSPC